MSGINLPIEVGQKFLSDGEAGEVVSVNRKHKRPVVWIGDTDGMIRCFYPDGRDVDVGASRGPYDLQPISVVITEGVEFSGEQYRDEFERLAKEGREFEVFRDGDFMKSSGSFFASAVYFLRSVPQHLDANGNALKVGDRVTDYRGRKFEIWEIVNSLAVDVNGSSEYLTNCRLLATKTRPLCADDLMANRTALFKIAESEYVYVIEGFDSFRVSLGGQRFTYPSLQEKWEWSPSADQPWQPCEVTEEALA